MSFRLFRINLAVLGVFVFATAWGARKAQQQQPISSLERGRTENMLGQIHAELKKNYYDPKFHGIDVDARYQTYLERLKKAPTLGDAYRAVAAYLSGLDDSHTFFIPPRRSYRADYGYRMQMIGDKCFITDVRPGRDAAQKLHPGDQVLSLGPYSVNRKDLWQLEYYLKQIAPQPATGFLLRDPNLMVGSLMDHDITIGKRVMRKGEKPLVAKSRGHDIFTGQLVVLVDSRSASAAELFSRVVQLEHRGTVVGDQSSGSVMESIFHPYHEGGNPEIKGFATESSIGTFSTGHDSGTQIVIFYGASITNADLIMTDGKSLEKVGVTPDVIVLPTAADLAEGRDPVLARAAELAGVKLDPVAAGKLFPFEWAPD